MEALSYLLEECGAAVDSPNAGGQTPLMGAAMSDEEEAVALLLAAGASLDCADQDGNTAFGWAASSDAAGCVEALAAAVRDPGFECQSPS